MDSDVYLFDGETFAWEKMHVKGHLRSHALTTATAVPWTCRASCLSVEGSQYRRSQTPFREQKDEVLFDLWTLDLTTKSWSEVVLQET